MVGVSEAATSVQEDSEVEEVVVPRSQYHRTMHRADPDSEEPRPACPQADVGGRERYRAVDRVAVASVYSECSNPECFGGDWR